MSLKERYIISGILTAEDNGTEVTGTGLCQPVYFLNDILNQNAVSHDGLPVNVSGRFWFGCRFLCTVRIITFIIWFGIFRITLFWTLFFGFRFIPVYSYRPEASCLFRYVYVLFFMAVLLGILCGLCPLEVHENHCRIVEYHCHEEKEYYLSVLHGCCNMMLDERAELSCGSGRICSPSLIPRLSRRSLRSVVPV